MSPAVVVELHRVWGLAQLKAPATTSQRSRGPPGASCGSLGRHAPGGLLLHIVFMPICIACLGTWALEDYCGSVN